MAEEQTQPEEATPAVPESPDAKIIVLREDTGETTAVPDSDEARSKFRKGAQKRRAIFEHNKAGALARSAQLPRLLTGGLAAGATNLMLVKIMQEELAPASAKEAAEVAKITHAIFREASGATAGNINLTPAERADRLNQIDRLEIDLKQKAKEATESLGGAPAPDEEVDPPGTHDGGDPESEWETT